MAKPMVKKGVQRVLLCGFMGCGKTSVGQALSFRLKWEFLDTDAMIEKREGRKIPEIFAQDGEAAFRQMEAQTAASLGRRRNTVISTGGGFLMQPETVKALRENGGGFEAIVFLDCSFETCYRRIQTSDRPLVRNNTKEGLEEIFNARREKYLSVADVVIQNEGIISSTVEEIVENLAIL